MSGLLIRTVIFGLTLNLLMGAAGAWAPAGTGGNRASKAAPSATPSTADIRFPLRSMDVPPLPGAAAAQRRAANTGLFVT